jgi:hypothetical protein
MSEGRASHLVQAMKELNHHWDRTNPYWHDVKAQQFHHEYLDALPNEVARTMIVMQDIAKLLAKIQKDCE